MKKAPWGYNKSDFLTLMLTPLLSAVLVVFFGALFLGHINLIIFISSFVGFGTLVAAAAVFLIGKAIFGFAKEIAPLAQPIATLAAAGASVALAPITDGRSLEVLNSSRKEEPKVKVVINPEKSAMQSKVHQHSFLKNSPLQQTENYSPENEVTVVYKR